MAIEETLFEPTNSLIQTSPCRFFVQKIPNKHEQLRHYISTAERDYIYFASNKSIFSFHIPSRRRELITSLPPWFEPRCLAAGFGWVCAGGPIKGICAFVDITRGFSPQEVSPSEVDALLPVGLDADIRRQTMSILSQRPPPFLPTNDPARPQTRIEEHGGSIVNSVTIHRFPGNGTMLDAEIVAVITNNDHTIRIYSLSQSRLIDTITHEREANYAIISPDGNLLAAVGDDTNRAYFYRKTTLPDTTTQDGKTYATFKWNLLCDPFLPPVKREEDRRTKNSKSCFTIAFSPSGHICAVASQGGILTLFDTSLLRAEKGGCQDAIIRVFQSSRPILGAVRAMSFSPSPWDLFVWTEDFGRACVVDLRNGCRNRQILYLNPRSESVDRVEMCSVEGISPSPDLGGVSDEERFLDQYREAMEHHDRDAAVNSAADYIEASAYRRRREGEGRESRMSQDERESSPDRLTEQERRAIAALQLSRSRRNASDQSDPRPRSIHYLNSYRAHRGTDETTPRDDGGGTSAFARNVSNLRDYIRQRNLERNRSNRTVDTSNQTPSFVTSRRGPVTMASFLDADVPPVALLSRRARANGQNSDGSQTTSQAWRLVQEAMREELRSPPSSQSSRALEAWVQSIRQLDEQHDRRMRLIEREEMGLQPEEQLRNHNHPNERMQRLMYEQEVNVLRDLSRPEYDEFRRRYETSDSDSEVGVGTAGLGFSESGRQLYVGTEKGIFEFSVNLQCRKTFPSLSFQ